MLDFQVDVGKCVKCGACVDDCPPRIINIPDGEYPLIEQDNEQKCMKCQHCYTVCPTGAISIFGLNAECDSVELNESTMPSAEKVETLIRGRRSTRKYKQENVDKDLIQKMLLATANCPTAVNNSALRFDVISDIAQMNEIRNGIMSKLVAYRKEQEFPPAVAYLDNAVGPWDKYNVDVVFRTAPHALIVSAPKEIPYCSIIDISIALSYFEIIANASGVGTTWCGMLKMSMELLPEYKDMLLTDGASDYYCMLFGYPDIKFSRTAKRDGLATINYI